MNISDKVLDWNIDYFQGAGFGGEDYVTFVCIHLTEMSRPDRRCKTGMRTWQQPCHHVYRSWYTIRELIEYVSEHIEQAHPEAVTESENVR